MTAEAQGDAAPDPVLHRLVDGVAWITLNRPEAGNALTAAMRDQMLPRKPIEKGVPREPEKN